ncbi:MAG: hypothetical protein ACW98D_05705 [Promethearchaeota archaeon]|jgi:hypothetical protein
MTQQKGEEFFMQAFDDFKFLNYYFQIPSDWARGFREMLMVSLIIYRQISPEIEASLAALCKNFAEKMQTTEDIFAGFYINEVSKYEEDDRERILKNESLIKEGINDLYWESLEETRKKSEEQKISQIENDRYIFESLEEILKGLKIISEEIESSESNLKTNPNITESLSNVKSIINDLHNGFIEKMTILDLEDENGMITSSNGLDDDTQRSKQELLKFLEEEIKEEEEEEEEDTEDKE